ncbi:MAG: glycosyltransferase [Vitreimonas sp.]
MLAVMRDGQFHQLARRIMRGIRTLLGHASGGIFVIARTVDRALSAQTQETAPLCLVSHDAYRHGAQLLLLALAQIFFTRFRRRLHIVILGPGPLTQSFRRFGTVYELDDGAGPRARALAHRLTRAGVCDALCSTTASGLFVETLAQHGVRCVALVHELPSLIGEKQLGAHAHALARSAAAVVFPSTVVRDAFLVPPTGAAIVRPQGIAPRRAFRAGQITAFRSMLHRTYGVPLDAKIAVGAGYGDTRKGIDLFVEMALKALTVIPECHFLWVGDVEPEMRDWIARRLSNAADARHFAFVPFTKEVAQFYAVADVFALTSREDPFPSVLLEAMDAGVPCVAFAGAGGFDSLFSTGAGILARANDTDAFADAVMRIFRSSNTERGAFSAAAIAVARPYRMQRYAHDLDALLGSGAPRISVVVPVYNYAQYLPERLQTILAQRSPVYEIIVIDDCSDDDSAEVARDELANAAVDYRVIENQRRSQCVFEQWRRGVQEARGELVWIAEADDACDQTFTQIASRAFENADVVLSYTQSRQIDERGKTLDQNYLTYVSDVDPKRWRTDFVVDGIDEIRQSLAIKNIIPNVSACLFRRSALSTVLEKDIDDICRFKTAGDWLTYVKIGAMGKIAFDHRALNRHRRHARSVTTSLLSRSEALREILSVQELIGLEFDISQEVRARAKAYIERLEVQFGLTANERSK